MKSLMKKGLVIGILCLLTLVSLPTVVGNDIEFPKEDGPYFIILYGDLLSCYRPSLFHIGPIWFLPDWEYIDLTFKSDPVLKVNGENYPVDCTITIYGLKGFFPAELGWTISSLYLNGNILVIGVCAEIDT